MRWMVIACLWLVLLGPLPAREPTRACLVEEAEAWLQDARVPGLSLALRSSSGKHYEVAVGQEGPGDAAPLATSHRLRIASLSKPVTALSVLALVEQGQLELETPVFGARGVLGGRWPELDRIRWIEHLTVRHLLQHSGGLGGWERDPMFILGDDATPAGDLVLSALSRYPPLGRPGREFRYANLGYLILGEVIEKASGERFEEHVHASVLLPAGVTGMRVGRNGRAGRFADEVAYAGDAAYTMVRPERFGPFGGWVATPTELLELLAWVEEPEAGGLSAATRQRMLRPSAPRHPGGRASRYGMGWEIDRGGYGHFGAMPGTQAVMRQRRSGEAWVAIANGLPVNDPEGLRLESMLQRAYGRCLP